MEIHRLKPMKEGYDKELFNRLYQSTENLRNSLARQIDARRYGVSNDIIKSWFDDKFIFVFNTYYGKVEENVLKGYIINSLKTFKFRVLRNAYSKHNIYNDSINIEDNSKLINIIPLEEDNGDVDLLLSLATQFMRMKLSIDAFTIFDIDLNPPPYITKQMASNKTKIPAKLIAEYLDLEVNPNSIQYINSLRREVQAAILQAKAFFKNRQEAVIL